MASMVGLLMLDKELSLELKQPKAEKEPEIDKKVKRISFTISQYQPMRKRSKRQKPEGSEESSTDDDNKPGKPPLNKHDPTKKICFYLTGHKSACSSLLYHFLTSI
jgi:hypothetical protein